MALFTYEPVPCPICGSADHIPVRRYHIVRRRHLEILRDVLHQPVTAVRCRSCGHHYLNPCPTQESLKAYYHDGYFRDHESAPTNRDLRLTLADRLYFGLSRRLPLSSGRLLDVGAGNRKFLLWAHQRGYEVQGFDAAVYPCVAGSESLPVEIGDFQEFTAFAPASFDLITLWWVIEHLREPVPCVHKIFSLLRPGGFFVIATSNYGSLESRFWGDYWHHLVLPEHVSQFSMASLCRLVEGAGFVVTRRRHDPLSFDTSLSLWELCQHKWGISLPLQGLAAKLLCAPFGPLRSFLRLSGLITVMCRKPR